MGEFWTRYFLDSGRRMSQRQMKIVAKLEEEILSCSMFIEHLEEEIARIKRGGEKKLKHIDFEVENDF